MTPLEIPQALILLLASLLAPSLPHTAPTPVLSRTPQVATQLRSPGRLSPFVPPRQLSPRTQAALLAGLDAFASPEPPQAD